MLIITNFDCSLVCTVVVGQSDYESEVVSEYVIKGNTAVLKCTIPSFVADFVRVEAWIASDGTEYTSTTDFGTNFFIAMDFCRENKSYFALNYLYQKQTN